WTATGVELIFGSSSAGTSCGGTTNPPPSQPPPCDDFVTGGGWITGTPSSARANFGVAGGRRNGALWGHLNYIDHGIGMHVKQTAVTAYYPDPWGDPRCRGIEYDVTIDGQAGHATVLACDKGEPGRDDEFNIYLSNGYWAHWAHGVLGGGNIQLHKCQ